MTTQEIHQLSDGTRASNRRTALRVIEGGSTRVGRAVAMPKVEPLRLAPQELAADMALLFAIGLLRDRPLETLEDPHGKIRLGPRNQFTVHELLCELRSMPWFEPINGPDYALTAGGDKSATLRRSRSVNGVGQLTLSCLFRNGIVRPSRPTIPSNLMEADRCVCDTNGPLDPLCETAPVSDWVLWCATHAGAGLSLPGLYQSAAQPQTLHDLAQRIEDAPAGRVFYNAALDALSQGTVLDAGLPTGTDGWGAGRLFSLLSKSEARARKLGLSLAADRDRTSRPAVMAARLSVMMSREDQSCSPDGEILAAAGDALSRFAPRLMGWMTRANRDTRRHVALDHAIFLPLLAPNESPPHPADLAPTVLVSAAMATVMKAMFDTGVGPTPCSEYQSGRDDTLAAELDFMVSHTAMTRLVKATHYPAENDREMRLGEAIALGLLRDRLEADNRHAALQFNDFDGAIVRLAATPRPVGRAHVMVYRDGTPSDWTPNTVRNCGPNLTAVV